MKESRGFSRRPLLAAKATTGNYSTAVVRLNIHKDLIGVCVRMRADKAEAEVLEERFATFTQELERLAAWLKEHKAKQARALDRSDRRAPSCGVLQYGLLRGSFIPPKPVRQMRD